MSKDFAMDLEKILAEYAGEITAAVADETETAMKNLVRLTKDTAPKQYGRYKKSISSRTLVNTPRVMIKQWYVKPPSHRLTHLLNNGHQTRNGGRYEGTGFLTNAYDRVEKEYISNVEEAIKNV